MNVSDLTLIHHLKQGPNATLHLELPHVFYLDTCQRQLWLTETTVDVPQNMTCIRGESAYEFLLSIACGLQSQVKGETEIFSQIKKAWRNFPRAERLLSRLSEDVKFIRSHYVEGAGGQSYGTLVRKALQPQADSHFLVVGAGKLAGSILPMLSDWPVALVNRSQEKALALAGRYPNVYLPGLCLPDDYLPGASFEELPQAAVTDILICRPFELAADQALMDLPIVRQIVHLGASNDELTGLNCPAGVKVSGLDDIFAWQTASNEVRQAKLARAGKACRERAKLRHLGTSVTLPHGWEDLAVFG